MAREIDDIQNGIIAEKNADPTLAGLNSTSKTASWLLWTRIIAICMWVQEKLWDSHKAEVLSIIMAMRPHTLRWYADMAKKFQYGYTLAAGKDYYDNTGISDALIAASMVVKYASCMETASGVRIKVATETGGDLAPLPTLQYDALTVYMSRVKDAGVKLSYTNSVADRLKLSLKVLYNPLILDATGKRRDGTANTPVQDAIRKYLKTGISFNGLFVLMKMTDELQKVEGVEIPHVLLAEATYGALPFVTIETTYRPDAGYLRIADVDLTLIFEASEPI